ncbi:LppA-related lipoprotein [Mesomycoplasma hyopneumoniae]|uniref:LppA-related lipoprotein n=1 Tax=Mesomycoplasma hyopneumoniae TaxID=2099 RepID=UPI003DA29571
MKKAKRNYKIWTLATLVPIFSMSQGCSEVQKLPDVNPVSKVIKAGNETKKIEDDQKKLDKIEKIEIKTVKEQEKSETKKVVPIKKPEKVEKIEIKTIKKQEKLETNTKKQPEITSPKVEIKKTIKKTENPGQNQKNVDLKPSQKQPEKQQEIKKAEVEITRKKEEVLKKNDAVKSLDKNEILLTELKAHLGNLPDQIQVANARKNDNPMTLVYKATNEYKNLSYYNIVNPIGEDNEKYELKLDFFNAKYNKNGQNKDPIENVKLILSLKSNPNIKFSKVVTVFYQKQEKTEKNYILKTKFPEEFKNIYPSFIAFLILNREKENVVSLPFFNEDGVILKNRKFGFGLQNELVEFKSKNLENDKDKYTFEVLSAKADDENGKLSLNLRLWKIKDRTERKETFAEIETVEISGFAKNSSKNYEFKLAEKDFEINLLKDNLKNKLTDEKLKSNFTKHAFLKILFEKMHVWSTIENEKKLIKISDLKIGNWLVYPQLMFLDLDPIKSIDNLILTKNGNKITWKLNLETYLLDKNQTLTPQSQDFLLGQKQIQGIQGSLNLDQVKKN